MLDKMKNVKIGTDHLIPPKPKISPAKRNVAIDPLKVRNLTLYDAKATIAEIRVPIKNPCTNSVFNSIKRCVNKEIIM